MAFTNTKYLAVAVVAAAAAARMAPTAFASIPEGSLDRVGAIYKNIHTIMAPVAAEGSGTQQGRTHLRQLQAVNVLTTRCFTECTEQQMSAVECQDHIIAQISAAGGHEVGEVQVKIQVPRTPEQLAGSYWMVEVPANIRGQFTCDRNEGQTFYPFTWQTSDSSSTGVTVENVNCQGLSAGECCQAIREYGKSLTTSGYDANGQCLACFAYQETLVPIVNEITGETDYLDYSHSAPSDSCVREQLTADEVNVLDAETASKVATAIASLKAFEEDPDCETFPQLLMDLYDAAVVIKPLSRLIGQLSCSLCFGNRDKSTGDASIGLLITQIYTFLNQDLASSKENCVIIYTNEEGNIVDTPKLGGSRADEPFDTDDCEDDTGGSNSCHEDPTICGATQYCTVGESTNLYVCKDYVATGMPCGEEHGTCNPDVAFCFDPYSCHELTFDAGSMCVEYGANSCGTATDSECASDEWCDIEEGRCKPNLGKGACCGLELNNCGRGYYEDLECAIYEHDSRNNAVYTCQTRCLGDYEDVCDVGSWCFEHPFGNLCDTFSKTGEDCGFFWIPRQYYGIPNVHCDPDTNYCRSERKQCDSSNFPTGTCTPLGPVCENDSDCPNPQLEWCAPADEGRYCPNPQKDLCPPMKKRCMDRYDIGQCCVSYDDAFKNMCSDGAVCSTVEGGGLPVPEKYDGSILCRHASSHSHPIDLDETP